MKTLQLRGSLGCVGRRVRDLDEGVREVENGTDAPALRLRLAYGLASLDPRVPADTTTRIAIGSVTKQFAVRHQAARTVMSTPRGRSSSTAESSDSG